jgi:hypothetical protein
MAKQVNPSVDNEYKIGMESADASSYAHVVPENVEIEVEPEEVDLSSFRKRQTLSYKIWNKDGKIDILVRRVLMDVADDFWESCNVKWVKPEDLILVGSICGYNWSDVSDIDLHFVVDFKKIHEKTNFVQEYFDEKKNDWNSKHDNLKIYGFNVELYVQDKNAEVESDGIYSLWQNKWIKKPSKDTVKDIMLDKYSIKDKSSEVMTEIDDLYDEFRKGADNERSAEIYTRCRQIMSHLKKERKKALEKSEFAPGNIIYKVLRRSGYLDKLRELTDAAYDRKNSVMDGNSFKKALMSFLF